MGQSDLNIARRFRERAQSKGLAFSFSRTPLRHNFLDINAGIIWGAREPADVLKLVRLANTYGEDYVLLGLVARRDKLLNDQVYWDRYYFGPNPEKYITLGEWLAETGHPYEPRWKTAVRRLRNGLALARSFFKMPGYKMDSAFAR